MTKAKGQLMFTDNTFLIRLNSLSDPTVAVANNVQYHQRYWVYAQCSLAGSSRVGIIETDQSSRVAADIEILNAIRFELSNPTGIALNMNNINKIETVFKTADSRKYTKY